MDTYAGVEEAPAAEVEEAVPAATARQSHRWYREALRVLAFYYVYQTIRSLANHGNIRPRAFGNATRIVRWERALHIYVERSVQQAFIPARWFIKIMNVYYGTLHFIITAGLLVWVYHYRSYAYRRMRNLLGLTTALALIGYWAFPLAPPRSYPNNQFVDTLDVIGGLWSYQSSYAKAVANPFAAMPSLHFGWALWCGVVFYSLTKRRSTRALCVLYPLLTLFAIVVTANHYFLDAVGGTIIFVAAVFILRLAERRRLRSSPLH